MKRFFNLLCLLAILAVAVVPAGAQDSEPPLEPLVPAPSAETGQMTDESTNLWFVELAGAPIADGGRAAALQTEKANFRREAQRAGLQFTERFAFDTLWNGLSISISPAQLATLNRIAGVKAVYPVVTIAIPEMIPGGDPDLATALAMTGADIAQSELGYTGAGIRVAVMDTGIDYHHPDLGGCFGPGCRVVTGWDFVGDAFNANPGAASYNPTPMPDPDPDDCQGHGTHVAGIVGANGTVVGVAPEVTFGAYRVFGCDGSTTADIMIAAMERALADDMDILNMSIGSAFQWPQYPTGAAATRLVNKGMVVVASIGNNGANGLYSAGSPGLGSKVIGVASFDNTNAQFATFTVTPANLTAGYTNATGAPPAPLSGSLPLARTGTPASTADACNPQDLGDLSGHAVLIRRGTCGFYEKARRAELAGAAAVVLYNNVAGRINPTVAVVPGIADEQPVTIPVVAISDVEGMAINAAMDGEAQTLNWQTDTLVFPNPTGGLISSFSSYGLSPDLALKPDIGAPGGSIWSTYPIEKGSYLNNSGTSMSSPHVAGAVALLLEARPNTPAQAVRGILQNSADPKNWWGNPGLGFLDNVHRQGAGMLDIDDAILATTKIEPAALALGESEAGPQMRTLVIENKSGAAVTYDLSFVNALSTGDATFAPTFFLGGAGVAFSADSIMVPAGGTASVNATITAPAGPVRGQYGGYIVFTPQGGGQVYRVPYAGFIGDYQSKQVLNLAGFPLIGRATACFRVVDGECIPPASYTVPPAGYVYSLTDVFNSPSVLVHLDHQVRRLRVEVFDANTGRAWHRAFDLQYVARNSTATGFFAFTWDGTTVRGNSGQVVVVPDGQYVLKLSVLKALGDDNNPAHWETWTSPVVTIDRP